jgi:hypothetical protein
VQPLYQILIVLMTIGGFEALLHLLRHPITIQFIAYYQPHLSAKMRRGFADLSYAASIVVTLAVVIGTMVLSYSALDSALSHITNFKMNIAVWYLAAFFISVAVGFHIIAYCFCRLLGKLFGKYWPTGIDYLYYLSAGALLSLLIAKHYNQTDIVGIFGKYEISASVVMLNLKLLKTTVNIYSWHYELGKPLVRDLWLGDRILSKELTDYTMAQLPKYLGDNHILRDSLTKQKIPLVPGKAWEGLVTRFGNKRT